MPSDPTKLSQVNEHSLPYRVLIDEILERRPGVVPNNVEDLLNDVDKASKEVLVCEKQETPDLVQYTAALKKCAEAEKPLKQILHQADLGALCFSGGGIRSASFGLGVLTGLAELSVGGEPDDKKKGVLEEIDYVSTVSGGGYVGSWFTAWIRNHPHGFRGVLRDLATFRLTSADPEAPPVRHLREYTSYLAPHNSAFSADTWTLAAIILRNLLLNWTILIPVFAALLLLPELNLKVFSWFTEIPRSPAQLTPSLWKLGLAAVFGLWALIFIALELPGNYKRQADQTSILWMVIPLVLCGWLLASAYLTAYRGGEVTKENPVNFWYLLIAAFVAHAGIVIGRMFVRWFRKSSIKFSVNTWWLLGAAIPSSFLAAGLLWLFAAQVGPSLGDSPQLFISLAVPMIWIAFMLSAVLQNGLSAKFENDEDREWWSRSGSYLLRGTLFWTVAHLIVLFSHEIMTAADYVFHGLKVPAGADAGIPALAVIIGGLASWAGFNPATAGSKSKVDLKKLSAAGKFLANRNLLIPALGGLFFVLLALALARANEVIGVWISGKGFWACFKPWMWVQAFELLALALIAWVFNCYINVNTFSLHAMYRSRLVRAYLGASNPIRKPNPFTNFDPNDDFEMQKAKPCKGDNPAPAEKENSSAPLVNAPLHLINITLNLVNTKKTAWQQRKAESFTVSRLHSGSFRAGYRRSQEYAGEKGITIGTAMAISGAAASPNMGYHSSPILTLVMTLFNARLGWWLPNPGPKGSDCNVYRRDSPRFSLKPLLWEALGMTTDQSRWIYLSDGGHFENLGLYEMVMRRCKKIIVVDGSADPSFTLEDLGNAVRKIHIDLGVLITFDPPVSLERGAKSTNRHCFVGKIRYSHADMEQPQLARLRELERRKALGALEDNEESEYKQLDSENGTLVYIKASLNGNEPADVTQYARKHVDFPHESTANQFFNESQFESYVQLGTHIVEETMQRKAQPPVAATTGQSLTSAGPVSLQEFIAAAK